MLALYIIPGILLLLFLLLCSPIRILASLRGGQPAVRLKYLFVTLPLYPLPEKDPDAPARPEKAKKPKPEKEKPPPEKLTLKQQWNRLRPFVLTSKDAAVALLGHIVVDRIRGQIVIVRANAHETALAYAQSAALVSALLELLGKFFTVKKHALTLTPGFAAEKGIADIALRVSLRPVFAAVAGVRVLFAFLRLRSRHKRRKPAPKPAAPAA